MTKQRNSYGLYDAPVRTKEPETICMSREEIMKHLEEGAIELTREDAIEAGLLNPYDEQDSCIVEVR